MTVQPGDVIRCTQHYIYDESDDFINIWHYKHAGASPVSDSEVIEGLLDEIDGVTGFLVPIQTELITYGLVEFYNLTQDEPLGSLPFTVNDDGSSAQEPLPTQCAALVTFRTGVKNAVGRRYVPGICEDNQSNGGDWSNDVLTALASYAAGVIGDVTIDGNSFVSGHWRRVAETFVEWVTPIIDTLVRTQRRRVKGQGS